MKLRDLLEQLTVELNIPKPEDAYDFDNIEVNNMGYGNYYKYTYTNINPHIKLYYKTDKGLENLENLVKKYGLNMITLSSKKETDEKITKYYLKITGSQEDINKFLKNHWSVFNSFNPKGSANIESGDKMEVTTLVSPPAVSATTGVKTQPGKVIYVAFGLYEKGIGDEESEERKYNVMTGAGDMIKVLATVVEAIKQTIKKEGGEDKIYGIKFAPSDKRRKSIYDHYLTTLFPSFEKDLNSSKAGFTMFINKNFKDKSLDEIGGKDEKMEPYSFTTEEDSDDYRRYSFDTPSGLKYTVELEEFDPIDSPMDLSKIILYGDDLNDKIPAEKKRRLNNIVLMIQFGVVDKEDITGGSNQNVVTNKGELYRVMNTVAAIIREDLAINEHIKYIAFDPAKRTELNPKSKKVRDTDISSNSRANLYTKYILGRIPNAEIIKNNMFDVLVKIRD